MDIQIQCKYCDSQMKIDYINLQEPTGTVVVTCPDCGAVGESFCESGLLKEKTESYRLINNELIMISVEDAADKARVG
jgi:uncharacterized Zn finger protein